MRRLPGTHTLRVLLLLTLFSADACIFHSTKSGTYRIATVDNNVCKKLYGDVVLYAVFVDTRYTHPWSEYDIRSTLDSIRKSVLWIERMAKENGIPLKINIQYHQNKKIIPIANDFPNKTLSGTLFPTISGVGKVDKWADKIAKIAGQSFTDTKDSANTIVKTKNKLSDRERLIARLRDIYKTDNVAVMYFINNYYKDEISVTLHAGSMTNTEYAVVSFKKPGVIAHEFLHIFGALDLYYGPFDKKRSIKKREAFVEREFPNEIMAYAHKSIDSLMISPFTKYLIGWDNTMDEKYRKMLLGKKIKVIKN